MDHCAMLCLAMAVSLFAGCGGGQEDAGAQGNAENQGESGSQPLATEEVILLEDPTLGITEEFQTALRQALIMLTDSENCYVEGTGKLTANGSDIALAPGTAFTDEGVLVPAVEYCEALGTELYCEDGLVLIGSGLEAGLGAATQEESERMLTALRSDLTPASGMAVQVDGTYEDRQAVSQYIAIDPLDYPYSTEKDSLVAVSGWDITESGIQ